MTETQPANPPIPFLRSNEEQALKMRRRLEDIFGNVELVHDVIVLSIEVCEANCGDFDPEMANVLRQCGANRLYAQLKALTNIIERFGGTTKFSKQEGEEAQPGVVAS